MENLNIFWIREGVHLVFVIMSPSREWLFCENSLISWGAATWAVRTNCSRGFCGQVAAAEEWVVNSGKVKSVCLIRRLEIPAETESERGLWLGRRFKCTRESVCERITKRFWADAPRCYLCLMGHPDEALLCPLSLGGGIVELAPLHRQILEIRIIPISHFVSHFFLAQRLHNETQFFLPSSGNNSCTLEFYRHGKHKSGQQWCIGCWAVTILNHTRGI